MKAAYKPVYLVLLATTSLLNACKKDVSPSEREDNDLRPVTGKSSAYVTQLFNYNPAPGQYINTNAGNMDAARSILNGKDGLVSLGAFGGSIVLGFDHTVINKQGQDDIIVYNNASAGFAEPGVVWVMYDSNHNGKPDDVWYELSGSAQNTNGYLRNYSITYRKPLTPADAVKWTDSQGKSGSIESNTFHTQSYYPEWITTDLYTLTGTLLPSVNIDNSNPVYVTSTNFAYGYTDNAPGSDNLDIERAVDANGNKVDLKGIDFIKVQTGIVFNLGWLGELSTEIKGVADISLAGK